MRKMLCAMENNKHNIRLSNVVNDLNTDSIYTDKTGYHVFGIVERVNYE